jgi:hypothetical protein
MITVHLRPNPLLGLLLSAKHYVRGIGPAKQSADFKRRKEFDMRKLSFGAIGIFLMAVVMVSCVSNPYTVSQGTERVTLSGKTAFLEVTMAPRSLAISPIIDATIYNVAIKGAEKKLTQVQDAKLAVFNEEVSEHYATQYETEVIQVVYPFPEDAVAFNFFSKATPEVKEQLAKICEADNAEIVVAMIGQINTVSVAALGINGRNQMRISLCVFDKTGKLIAEGNVATPPQIMTAGDETAFGLLFEDGIEYTKTLNNALVQ